MYIFIIIFVNILNEDLAYLNRLEGASDAAGITESKLFLLR